MTSLLQADGFAERSPRAVLMQPCTLTDLTAVARVGFRGADSAVYLQARGYRLPAQPNQAERQGDGAWVARLSQTEYLLLGALADHGAPVAALEAQWVLDDNTRNYLLPRQDSHAWLQLAGEQASAVMAKLCGVDLREGAFAVGSVAQTSAARINVIVVNTGGALQLLFDRPSLNYFLGAVEDAMAEFEGVVEVLSL
ncbi:sarcosine oxidase subunit gamma [Pseudomonas xanthosomatis]|uniref:sarcosine oxidase subunit gamma n=1 Tax=Pseudomonas xanthosomatis TaxID=2842356 RepID=UPI0035187B25